LVALLGEEDAHVTVIGPRTQGKPRAAGPSVGVRSTVRAYVALTKPRIIELLLVTTVPTMILAAAGWPPLGLALATLLGGTLAAAGANTFNSYLDRDIDGVMVRTKHRPLVTGAVTPRAALVFAWVLSIGSVAFMAMATNLLASLLTGLSIVFYVVIYTMLLKRRTAQNIVWGGAAGCMPVLIGWSAVTGSLAWPAWVLFAVIFLWTPPHYWPLSLRFSADYAAARVPMLPVVAEQHRVARQIVLYSWAMVLSSLALIPVAGMGPIYSVASVLLGAGFLFEAHALQRRVAAGRDAQPMRLFHGSITYLSLLFLAVAIDPLVF
jgi:protoheme IX farnesyltransferase